MSSLRRHEGYLSIDHRESPGLSEAAVHGAGLPPGAGSGLFEAPTYTCSHCCRVVIVNPLRTRAREWCAKCDKIICDDCSRVMAATGECKPFKQIVEEIQEAASRQEPILIPGE